MTQHAMPSDTPAQSLGLSEQERAGLWIVIAAYNEERAVGHVVRELREHYPHVVLVDDGSRDRTAEVALAAGAIVLSHAINRGQGAALQTGISYALEQAARVIVTFDADGQHRTADLPAMTRPIFDGQTEVCLGSRLLEHAAAVPWFKRCVLRLAVWFTRLTSRLRLSDAHNGFRAFSRHAADQLELTLDRMAHASELIDQVRRAKLPYREVSVRVEYSAYSRAKGQPSTAALKIALDYLLGRVLK